MANDVREWWRAPAGHVDGPAVKVGEGVTNDPAAYRAMLERRRKAGDTLGFTPAAPRDAGEYPDRGGKFDFPTNRGGW